MKKELNYIFVDMDGVLCDFLRGCESYLGHPLTNDDKGHTEYDLRKEELTNLVVYDKNQWIDRYVDPSVVVNCTFTGSQKAAYAMDGNVLIDDRPKNIEAWEDAGGIGILHTSAKETINKLKELRNGE